MAVNALARSQVHDVDGLLSLPRDSIRRMHAIGRNDETLSGSRGFWVLVVPGQIRKNQPRFNDGPAMWHLEGATLPLSTPLP